MSETPEIILFDSDEAAKHMNMTGLSGWVDRFGRYWGKDENAARYSGCTHQPCEDCGEPIQKNRLICAECWYKRKADKYYAMPKITWDGKTPLYSDAYDKFFFNEEEVRDFIEFEADDDASVEDLHLVICEPVMFPDFDDGSLNGYLSDDGGIPKELSDAIDEYNEVVRSLPPASWRPGKYAAIGVLP